MTVERAVQALSDIKQGIVEIRLFLAGTTFDELRSDRKTQLAFERLLEIVSEASRFIPQEWKAANPDVPWRNVRDFGNHLRHAYQKVDLKLLWAIYADDLDPLEAAIDAMLAAHPDE